jgi:hypothetical protein
VNYISDPLIPNMSPFLEIMICLGFSLICIKFISWIDNQYGNEGIDEVEKHDNPNED